MRAEDIRRVQATVPFKPFLIELSSGTRLPVRHPETLAVTENMGAVATLDGKDLVLFAPQQVCAIHPYEDGRKKRTPTR